jgi:hypothetical protein
MRADCRRAASLLLLCLVAMAPFELKTPVVSIGPLSVTNVELVLYLAVLVWILSVRRDTVRSGLLCTPRSVSGRRRCSWSVRRWRPPTPHSSGSSRFAARRLCTVFHGRGSDLCPAMSIQVLQRAAWDGRPVKQAEFIRLTETEGFHQRIGERLALLVANRHGPCRGVRPAVRVLRLRRHDKDVVELLAGHLRDTHAVNHPELFRGVFFGVEDFFCHSAADRQSAE